MATIVAQVCDVCSELGVAVREWTIKDPQGDEHTVDLCSKHEKPLRSLADGPKEAKRTEGRGRSGGRTSGSSKRRVLSMEEVEELRSK